jgi:tetratricopeptide (TPR) repeat protein
MPPPGTPVARFLVLDSHQVLRGLLPSAVESVGPVRMQFASSAAAWEQLLSASSDFDFLIADWDTCDGGGLALVHGLRLRPSLREASVVFLADRVSLEMRALMPLYRIAAFIQKPFSVAEVAASIRAELARRQAPERLDLLLNRAWRLLEEGSAPKALLVYQWLRGLHPESLMALYGAGAALGAVGEVESGLLLLEDVVSASPLFLDAWNRMSDLAETDGDLVRAEAFAERAAALAPGAPEVLLRRARIAQRSGQSVAAERLLRECLKAAPELWAPAFELTELLLAQDRVYDAARVVDRVRPHQRGRIDLLNHLGVALRRRGHLAAARQTYALALAEQPRNPAILYNAAVAHLAAGDRSRALDDLTEAVMVSPEFDAARQLLERVQRGEVPAPAELQRL